MPSGGSGLLRIYAVNGGEVDNSPRESDGPWAGDQLVNIDFVILAGRVPWSTHGIQDFVEFLLGESVSGDVLVRRGLGSMGHDGGQFSLVEGLDGRV